jgi:hypothetical protein
LRLISLARSKNPRTAGGTTSFLIRSAVKNAFTPQTHDPDLGRWCPFGIVMRHAARVAAKLALGAPAAPVAHTNLKYTVLICGHKLINKMLVLPIF